MELIRLKSSNIAGAGYVDGDMIVLFVGNPGPVYQYVNADVELFNGLVGALSPGKFFAANIRDPLKGQRLPEEEWASYTLPAEKEEDE